MTFDMRELRSATLFFVFTGSVLSLTLGWIYVSPPGAAALRLPYLVVPFLGLALLAFPNRFAVAMRHLAAHGAIWLTLYFLYLLVLAIKLAGLPDGGLVFRQVFFITCAITFGAGIIALGAAPKLLRYGGGLSIIGFLFITELIAWQMGLSWLIAFKAFGTSGDFDFVTYEFLRELFRFTGPDAIEVPASEKNLVAVALFTVLVLFRAGYDGAGRDVMGWLVTALAVLILVLLNTRSVLVVAGLSLVLVALLGVMHRKPSVPHVLLSGLLVAGGAVASVLILSSDFAALSSLQGRLSFDDPSAAGRAQQIGFAIVRIEDSILAGSGLAEINGQLVHNLFLGAWMHAGLPAFLLVTSAYVVMVGTWVAFIALYKNHPERWVLPLRAEWVAIMPVLFFFRVWIAGDAGHPGFGEWIGFFSFHAILIVNDMAVRSQVWRNVSAAPEALTA